METKIGIRIKHIRESHNLSLDSLSKKLGISLFEMDRIEKGISVPSLSFIRRFCDDFRIPTDFLFGRYQFHSSDALKKPFDLRSVLMEFILHYKYVKQFPITDSYFVHFTTREVPSILSQLDLPEPYTVFCHTGNESWLDTPQIHFSFPSKWFSKEMAEANNQKFYLEEMPYHLMFVFPKDMSGVYLSIVLNPYKDVHTFSSDELISTLADKKKRIQKQFSNLYDDMFLKDIHLDSTSLSSQLIENGLIAAVYYDKKQLVSNEEFLEDLTFFSESYQHFLENLTFA